MMDGSSKSMGGSSRMDGSSSGGGARRRAKAPVNVAAMLAAGSSRPSGPSFAAAPAVRISSSSSRPEPSLAIVKPADRGFANNQRHLKEMPVPGYFQKVVAAMDNPNCQYVDAVAKHNNSLVPDPKPFGSSNPAAAGATCILDEMGSAEFDLLGILAGRSGEATDELIKQQEALLRMHQGPGAPKPTSRSLSPTRPQAREHFPVPRINRPLGRSRTNQEEEDLGRQQSFHNIIAARSHGVATDDELKQQELQRMKDSTATTRPGAVSVVPSAPKPTSRSLSPRPQGREHSPVPRINRPRGRPTVDQEEEELGRQQSFHNIIAARSHGVATDDEIKQQELQRMKDSSTAAKPGAVSVVPSAPKPTSRSLSPRPQAREHFPVPRINRPLGSSRTNQEEEELGRQQSFHKIIAARSHGAATDDEIKQQELQRMKDSTATTRPGAVSVVPSAPKPTSRSLSPRPQARDHSPVPRINRPFGRSRTNQEEEDLGRQQSFHSVIAARSHGVGKDDEIKQQELQRMKDSASASKPGAVSVVPSAPKPTRSLSPRPQGREHSPVPTVPRIIRRSGRSPADQEDDDLGRQQSFHNIIAVRSHGVATDDEIKQQELQRMKDSKKTRKPGAVSVTPATPKRSSRSVSPRPEASERTRPQPRTVSPRPLPRQRSPATRKNVPRGGLPPKQEEGVLSRGSKKDSAIVTSEQATPRPPKGTTKPLSTSQEDLDASIKKKEEDMTLNSILAERANNANAEALANADSRRRSKENDSSSLHDASNTINFNNQRSSQTSTATAAAQVEYSSSGQPMTKHKMPLGSKKPGAYSGAPGAAYNRVRSLRLATLGLGGTSSLPRVSSKRLPTLGGSCREDSVSGTFRMEDSSSFQETSARTTTNHASNCHLPESSSEKGSTRPAKEKKRKGMGERLKGVKGFFKFGSKLGNC